jgi:hypothetical protein
MWTHTLGSLAYAKTAVDFSSAQILMVGLPSSKAEPCDSCRLTSFTHKKSRQCRLFALNRKREISAWRTADDDAPCADPLSSAQPHVHLESHSPQLAESDAGTRRNPSKLASDRDG